METESMHFYEVLWGLEAESMHFYEGNGRRPPVGRRVRSPEPPRAGGPPTKREPWPEGLTGKNTSVFACFHAAPKVHPGRISGNLEEPTAPQKAAKEPQSPH